MCCLKKRKRSINNTIDVLPSICTPNIKAVIDPFKKIEELEGVFNEIINQLNSYFEYKIKTQDETLENIYSLILLTCKKYNISNYNNDV